MGSQRWGKLLAYPAGCFVSLALITLVLGAVFVLLGNESTHNEMNSYHLAVQTYATAGYVNFNGSVAAAVVASDSKHDKAPMTSPLPYRQVASFVPPSLASLGSAFAFPYTYYNGTVQRQGAPSGTAIEVTPSSVSPLVSLFVEAGQGSDTAQLWFDGDLPLFVLHHAILSSSNPAAAARLCESRGGYVSVASSSGRSCTQLSVLTSLCARVATPSSVPSSWSAGRANLAGLGCTYPFAHPGVYSAVPFTSGTANVTVASIDVRLVSADSPEVALGRITDGTGAFESSTATARGKAGNRLLVAFAVCGVLGLVFVALVVWQRRGGEEDAEQMAVLGGDMPSIGLTTPPRAVDLKAGVPSSVAPLSNPRALLKRYFVYTIVFLTLGIGAGVPLISLANMAMLMPFAGFVGTWLLLTCVPAAIGSMFQFYRSLHKLDISSRAKRLGFAACAMVLLAVVVVLVALLLVNWHCTQLQAQVGVAFETGGCVVFFHTGYLGFVSLLLVVMLTQLAVLAGYLACTARDAGPATRSGRGPLYTSSHSGGMPAADAAAAALGGVAPSPAGLRSHSGAGAGSGARDGGGALRMGLLQDHSSAERHTSGGGSGSRVLSAPDAAHGARARRAAFAPSKRVCMLALFIIIPVLMVADMLFPPLWNLPMIGYIQQTSKYSLILADWFGPVNYPTATYGNSNYVNLKLYPDVLAFWTYVVFLLLCSLSLKVHRLHRLFHRRFRVRGTPYVLTVGETLVGVTFVILAVWWFFYFTYTYERIAHYGGNIGYTPAIDPTGVCGYFAGNPDSDDSTLTTEAVKCTQMLEATGHGNYVRVQRLARGLGHMSTFFLTFGLVPVARNSMWTIVFGIPFERAIAFHRLLALGFFLAVTGHLVSWVVFWGQEGVLHNLVSLTGCDIVPNGSLPHCDNFTIPMMGLTWLGMCVMVTLSYWWVRRKYFELFYYAHHFFVVVFVASLVHAWGFWLYATGPLVLWWFDRMIRMSRSTLPVRVEHIEFGYSGHTALVLKVDRRKGFSFAAGQYAFVNIPAISTLQWHPFSISSDPNDPARFSFHIKAMGKGTFTHRLSQLAQSPDASALDVNIDGPYGRPIDYWAYKVLVLVAGGIGVTPMHSILADVYTRTLAAGHGGLGAGKAGSSSSQPIGNGPPRDVRFLWGVRQPEALNMFADTFAAIEERNPRDTIKLRLHASRARAARPAGPGVAFPFAKGRVDVREELKSVLATARPHEVAVLVCGPPVLVNDVSKVALKLGIAFHTETFAL